MIRSKVKLLLNIFRHHGPLEGLEPRAATLNYTYGVYPAWFSGVKKHAQVISPGRSGTRWLANILLESSNALVCHSTPKTLSEAGYFLNQSLISEEEALGAYRFSRSDYLKYASLSGRPFVDLDCKNSPLAHVIASAYPDSKFIILIRNPISFIRSGIARGYFLGKNPQAWGHLEPLFFDENSFLASKDIQIFKIASFWRCVARLSQEIIDRYPSRALVVNSSSMFKSPEILDHLMGWLDIDHSDITACKSYTRVVNASQKKIDLSADQNTLLDSDLIYDFCLEGLGDELIAASGFGKRINLR